MLITLNENVTKLCVVANNGKCIQLKYNNEKVIFHSLLITEATVEGPECTGHMAHLTTPDGVLARPPGGPFWQTSLLPLALTPSPRAPAALLLYAALSWQFPLILLSVHVFSPRVFLKLLPCSGPRPICDLTSKGDQHSYMDRHFGLSKRLIMISQLQISEN